MLLVENVGITCGYLAAAFLVAPLLPVSRVTRIAGVVFFLTCGATHLHMAVHSLLSGVEPGWHEHLIAGPQMVAIWAFATYFHRDLEDLAHERQTTRRAAPTYEQAGR